MSIILFFIPPFRLCLNYLFFLQKSFSFLNLIPSSSPQSGYQADDEFSLGSVGDPSNHSTAEVSKASWPFIATSGQARAAHTCLPKTKIFYNSEITKHT